MTDAVRLEYATNRLSLGYSLVHWGVLLFIQNISPFLIGLNPAANSS